MANRHPTATLSKLNALGEQRDALLVLASVLYVLGYLVWSAYALENRLGLLPALDAQYFVAGIFPAALALGLFHGFRALTFALERYVEWVYGEPPTRSKQVLRLVVYVLTILPLLLWLGTRVSRPLAHVVNRAGGLVFVLFPLALLGSMLYHRDSADASTKGARRYRLFQVGNLFALLGVLIFGWFLKSVYPRLPQEIGGVRPRCAQLDLARAQLSPITLTGLITGDTPQDSSATVLSIPVDVLYGSDALTVIRAGGKVFRLRGPVILAETSCG